MCIIEAWLFGPFSGYCNWFLCQWNVYFLFELKVVRIDRLQEFESWNRSLKIINIYIFLTQEEIQVTRWWVGEFLHGNLHGLHGSRWPAAELWIPLLESESEGYILFIFSSFPQHSFLKQCWHSSTNVSWIMIWNKMCVPFPLLQQERKGHFLPVRQKGWMKMKYYFNFY